MANEISSSYTDIRIGGLVSGLDTDSIVESLMKIEQAKVNRIELEKTYSNWETEAYREVIDKLSTFSKEQYNKLDSSQNILSTSNLKTVDILENSSYVSIIANGDALSGSYTINEIVQLAKASSTISSAAMKEGIESSIDITVSPTLEVEGMSFFLRLDSNQEQISFSADFSTSEDLLTDIQAQLNQQFGTDRVIVSLKDDKYLTFNAPNSTLQIIGDTSSPETLEYLGLTSGDMNIININASIEEEFGTAEDISFSINGVEFSFDKSVSLIQIIDQVNESSAKVRMTYDSVNDTIKMESTKTGAGSEIVLQNITGSMFGNDGYLKIDEGTIRNGQDAMFYLNDSGKTDLIQRSSNVFTIDNVTYSLKKESTSEINFLIADNTQGAFDKIKSFIEGYNEILDMLSNKINEKKDYDYSPLSDTQKESMTEKEIEDWEAKAKLGILKSDNILYNIYRDLRNAFITQIEDADESFKNIGISTISYANNGKIDLDEATLKSALEDNMENVIELFNKPSSVAYTRNLTSEEAATRYSQSGFALRVSDILSKNITTIRDNSGFKGLLVEKAGIVGDASEFDNFIKDRIDIINERLEKAIDRMNDQEDLYWSKFTALEQAIQTMNSQSSWLNSQLGT
ncbi:MAG: flagellar filament capping protein FliD [Clostridia bacterium]|nr:flagellar filament capping protein FliD [Clostridia bacterium]